MAESEYVDFICNSMEPIVKNLVSGGTIALNISADVFLKGLPARSLTPERVVIAMHERLGLWRVDSLIWANASKAPGPIAWASKKRALLNTGYEPIYIFSNDPSRKFSSNPRVLQPHTERHLKLIAKGGENRTGVYGDGANKIYPGSFGAPTEGRIPRNVLQFGGRCHSQTEVRRFAKEQGLNERALSCQERNLNSARLQETTQQTGIVAWARDVLNERQQLELALFRGVNRDGHGEVDMHEFPGDGGNPCPSGLEFPWVFEDVLEKVSARGFARLRKQWNFAMRPLPPQTMAAGRA